MKSILIAFLLITCGVGFSQVPDNPTPQPTPPQPKFLTFRASWKNPPLRTNKQVFLSKKFIVLHAAFAITMIYDIKHTHAQREHWGSELPALPVIVGMDYIADRFFCECMSTEAPIYGIVHYARDAAKGP